MNGTPMVYFQSLNRPLLMLGVDRRFLIITLMFAILIPMSAQFSWLFDLLGLVFFVVCHTALVLMYRVDPLIYELYRRHSFYKEYYRAQPTVFSPIRFISPSVPVFQGKKGVV